VEESVVDPLILHGTVTTASATSLGIIVARPYTTVEPETIKLKTKQAFDGTGLFTRTQTHIKFSHGGTELTFDGTDNRFTGAELTGGVEIRVEAVSVSAAPEDVEIKLELSGGSATIGPPAQVKLTAVQTTFEICEPRVTGGAAPTPLPTATAAPGGTPTDKFYLGRPIPLQGTTTKLEERALLKFKDIQPAGFDRPLEIRLRNDKLAVFTNEGPTAGEVALAMPHKFQPSAGLQVFVEGAKVSGAARDTGIVLSAPDMKSEADHVQLTVCHTEAVSNKKPADFKLVAQVPEKPERLTKSLFIVAPIIIGVDYEVEMRPYIELATPSAYQWSTASANITLTNPGNEVVGIKGASLSAALDDIELELLLTTDLGKLKKKHKLTCVKVEIDPIISGDNIRHTDDINTIKNPSGCVVLSGADASDATKVPKYEITKIEPAAIGFTADDDRIAWRIHGGDTKGNNKYDGNAQFMNTEPSKRGLKIQVHGVTEGDVLIEPYNPHFPRRLPFRPRPRYPPFPRCQPSLHARLNRRLPPGLPTPPRVHTPRPRSTSRSPTFSCGKWASR